MRARWHYALKESRLHRVAFSRPKQCGDRRGLASDVNTPFNSIPIAWEFTKQHVRVLRLRPSIADFRAGRRKLKEAKADGLLRDGFLSAGITSNNNESNSYSLRQRQVWGQAALHGLEFHRPVKCGAWSRKPEKVVDNRSEALPMTIDAQYHVGFSWARQYGFRVARTSATKSGLACRWKILRPPLPRTAMPAISCWALRVRLAAFTIPPPTTLSTRLPTLSLRQRSSRDGDTTKSSVWSVSSVTVFFPTQPHYAFGSRRLQRFQSRRRYRSQRAGIAVP